MTLAMGSVGMQIASQLSHLLSPQRQIFIGGSIFCGSMFLAQYATTFIEFFFVYAILMGLGFGLLYFLPVQCAWTFFPDHTSTVGGIILCFYSIGAVLFATYTA
jgi:MFS family permease